MALSFCCALQIGWVLKGLVYAIIGGLACQSSAQGKEKIKGADISPQVHLNFQLSVNTSQLHC